jgi:hypothetical protein
MPILSAVEAESFQSTTEKPMLWQNAVNPTFVIHIRKK